MIYTYKKYDTSLYLDTQYGCGLGEPEVLCKDQCIEFIEHMGLFKFKGYLYAFKNELSSRGIEDILMLYGFDRFLSKYLMDLSLKVEAGVKTALVESAYALTENPFFYLDTASYNETFFLNAQEERDWTPSPHPSPRRELYKHYRDYYLDKYDFSDNRNEYLSGRTLITSSTDANFPPFHYFIESATLGTVIKMIRKMEIRGEELLVKVALNYRIQPGIFPAYLQRLNELRNRCAHNGRLFNRNYRSVKAFRTHKQFRRFMHEHRIIDVIVTMFYLLGRLNGYSDFSSFENDVLETLMEDFKNDSECSQYMNGLTTVYDEQKFESLKRFIFEGMGKK